MTQIGVDHQAAVDEARMQNLLEANADRCCFCQRRTYTLANPKITVVPSVAGRPALVAHAACNEPVQSWRRSRM